jgi:hypothetical protein
MSPFGFCSPDGPDPDERGDGAGITMWDIDEYERRKAEKEAAKSESITDGILKIKQLADEIRALRNAPLCDDPTHPIFGS